MNFGTWKVSTATCQNTITARCTIRMIAKDRADRPLSAHRYLLPYRVRFSGPSSQSYARRSFSVSTISVDYGRNAPSTRSTTCLRRARFAAGLRRSVPKIADSVGVFEKKK